MQLHPTEATNTNHPKMTQYYKEQLPPQWTSSRPMQLMQQVVTNRGDAIMPQAQAQTQSTTEQQPDQPVSMDYKMTIHQAPPELRNGPTCFRCGEQGHMRAECRERVFCNHCRSYNHDTKACRKQHNNILSPAHSQIVTGYHPTATPPPLMGTTAATQPTGTHNNPLFNLLDNNQPRTSTIMHTPHNGTSPAMPADLVE